MQTSNMLPKLKETTQTISFGESEDGDYEMTSEVYATDVRVTTNAGTHSHGSSMVKLRNLVDYNWEPKPYTGQLLAVHMSGKYLAYCIKVPNAANPGTWCGMVRVVYNPEPGTDRRALIKGMKGEVQDLAFAHIQNQVVLACIDEQGNFYVHEIEVTDSGLRCTLITEIREENASSSGWSRVVWCPYIPDEEDVPDDDVAMLLLTTHGTTARMWNIRAGSPLAGCAGAGHSAAILAAAFSPDGTALATASNDGYVMFFQVYMNSEGSPRCLHKWQPHGGKPLSCLFFLDNHKQWNTNVQFWKFAVTGAENNTVIKIWSCKSWKCLQTITFSPNSDSESLGLKAMLDTSASYLLLSDFRARSLYVLHMARDKDDTMAYCRSISEFLLPYPVLSFCIVDAEEEQVKSESRCDEPFHRNGSSGSTADSPDDFNNDEVADSVLECSGSRVRIRLYIVQPKGLQEGELIYCPPRANGDGDIVRGVSPVSLPASPPGGALPPAPPAALDLAPAPAPPAPAAPPLAQQSLALQKLLLRQTQPGLLARVDDPAALPLNLMTPDAFSSPGKRDEDDPPLSTTPDLGKPRSSNGGVMEEVAIDGKLISGGSSPSREVQEIMAHNGDEVLYNENLEEESSQTPVVEEEEEEGGSMCDNQGSLSEQFPTDMFNSPEITSTKLAHRSSETSWPQISLAQITEANQRKASSDKSSSQSLNNSLNVSAIERAASEHVHSSGLSAADKARLESLEHKLDKLCDLVVQQGADLRSVRGELQSGLKTHAHSTSVALQDSINEGWERIARVGEAASARAAAAAGVGAARALEPLAAALQRELAAKLTATDLLLRENIDKLAHSKTIMERLSTAIAKSLSDMVRESFRSALFESVVPVMEKAHAQIFRQINQAFQNGTKEFAANTEAAARAAAERGGANAAQGLRAALDRHTEALARAAPPHQLLAQTVKDVTHSVLEKELTWWREQARNMSRAHSPATPAASHCTAVDRQMQVAQIQSLMGSGDMNGAFQLALSASDLALVVAACRAASPARVFGPPCALRQHVLLSLVQQLAADMPRDTALKHMYLEEAIMNLDTSNPVTREHLPVVVRELQKQIMAFLSANPAHALSRKFKMLLMATDSLVKSAV